MRIVRDTTLALSVALVAVASNSPEVTRDDPRGASVIEQQDQCPFGEIGSGIK